MVTGGTIATDTIDYANKVLRVVLRASTYPQPGTYLLFDYGSEVNGTYTANLLVDPGDTGLTIQRVFNAVGVAGTIGGKAIYVSLV